MIFETVRTERISVQLQELTLGDGIDLCKLPGERHERTTTEMLRRVARDAKLPSQAHVANPLLWTVEERIMIVAKYLAQVTPDGPNFSVSEKDGTHLADYIDLTSDLPAPFVSVGMVGQSERILRPLLGIHAETLELMCATRGQWVLGAMACQMSRADEPEPDWLAMSDVQLREWIDGRITLLKSAPESWFVEILAAWERGRTELAHFFDIGFTTDGIVCHATREGEAGAVLPSARFRALSCVSSESKFFSD